MICDNRGSSPVFDLPDTAMLHRLAALVRRRSTVPLPWEYERLATPEEITRLRLTDLRRAA